jgi:molybdopterin-guanine dinucleotide biosynthesis protein A
MDSIEGFILAGGQSRRMGTDKSLLTIDGQSFVERIATELSAVASSITVVGNTAFSLTNLPTSLQRRLKQIPDIYADWGALGGVHAALSACQASWALIVACDFPFVTEDLFIRMAAQGEAFDAVAPIQEDRIPQPLCSFYRVNPCLVQAGELIKSGERKPIALLQSVRTRWLLFEELSDLQNATHFFDNINTREDYARIVEKGSGGHEVPN